MRQKIGIADYTTLLLCLQKCIADSGNEIGVRASTEELHEKAWYLYAHRGN